LFGRRRAAQFHGGGGSRIGADDHFSFQVRTIILESEAQHVGWIVVVQELPVQVLHRSIVDDSQTDHG
jgi:hypothetical protein